MCVNESIEMVNDIILQISVYQDPGGVLSVSIDQKPKDIELFLPAIRLLLVTAQKATLNEAADLNRRFYGLGKRD